MELLISGIHPNWDKRGESWDKLWKEECHRDYILISCENRDFLIIKKGSNKSQITTKTFREEIERSITTSVIEN